MSNSGSNSSDSDSCQNTEHSNPDSQKSVFSGKNDADTQDSGTPTESLSNSTKRTAEHAGLNTMLNEGVDGNSPKKCRNITFEEESNFADLFFTALKHIIEFKKIKLEFIEEVAQMIKDSFHYDKGRRFTDIDYKISENIYGFFYRYGVLSAGVVRCKILEALSDCKELRSQLSVSSLKIISLGSGPGCDIIGLCSALHEYKYGKVELTLVDKYKGWRPVFNVIEFLTREGEYGNASLMFQNSDVSTTFLRKDLSDNTDQNEAYLSALKGADVVLISRLFSISDHLRNGTIAKTVTESMKQGASLILIESPIIADATNLFFCELDKIYRSKIDWQDYYVQGSVHPGVTIAEKSNAQIYVMKKNSK